MSGTDGIPRFTVYANGSVWGSYLTREDAEIVAERLKRKGMKVSIREGYRV